MPPSYEQNPWKAASKPLYQPSSYPISRALSPNPQRAVSPSVFGIPRNSNLPQWGLRRSVEVSNSFSSYGDDHARAPFGGEHIKIKTEIEDVEKRTEDQIPTAKMEGAHGNDDNKEEGEVDEREERKSERKDEWEGFDPERRARLQRTLTPDPIDTPSVYSRDFLPLPRYPTGPRVLAQTREPMHAHATAVPEPAWVA